MVHLLGIEIEEADHESRIKATTEWELPGEVSDTSNKSLALWRLISLHLDYPTNFLDMSAGFLTLLLKTLALFLFAGKTSKFYACPAFSLILKMVRKAAL